MVVSYLLLIMLTIPSLFIKYLLCFLNIVYFGSGLVLIYLGVEINNIYYEYKYFLDDHFFSTTGLFFTIGSIIILVSLLGFHGITNENYCVIMIFGILLGIIFMMEVTGGFASYVLASHANEALSEKLNQTIYFYNKDMKTTEIWDSFQRRLKCCGVTSFSNWYHILHDSLPLSCCEEEIGAINLVKCNYKTPGLYHQSCLEVISHIAKENVILLGTTGLGVSLLQLLGIGCCCVLSRSIRTHYETV